MHIQEHRMKNHKRMNDFDKKGLRKPISNGIISKGANKTRTNTHIMDTMIPCFR